MSDKWATFLGKIKLLLRVNNSTSILIDATPWVETSSPKIAKVKRGEIDVMERKQREGFFCYIPRLSDSIKHNKDTSSFFSQMTRAWKLTHCALGLLITHWLEEQVISPMEIKQRDVALCWQMPYLSFISLRIYLFYFKVIFTSPSAPREISNWPT